MHDQANDLRELVRQGTPPAPTTPSSPYLLVITGGKGGAGTTTIAVNLAVVLAGQGHRTALVDADRHGGDAAMLCRVEERYTLADVLEARRTVGEVLQPGPGGLWVLPAAWAPESVCEASRAAHQRLIAELQGLGGRLDFVVVDAGNGLNRLVRRLWHVADMVLVVTTPEPASVMDAYASIKVLTSRRSAVPVRTVVNRAPDRSAAREVHSRLAQACLRFLALYVSGAGYIRDDPQVAAAGRARRPLVCSTPGCRPARQIRRLAKTVVRQTKRPALTT